MWYRKSQVEESSKAEWEMTPEEFAKYHHTGHISSDAYEQYSTPEGMNWIKRESHPELYKTMNVNGNPIDILLRREKSRYVKHRPITYDRGDGVMVDDTEIDRDEQGQAQYLTDEEAVAKGYDLEEVVPAAFHGDNAVGWSSNEWGSSGMWVANDYQRQGLGTELMHALRKLNPRLQKNKIGQMTNAGFGATMKFHKRIVEDALAEGKPVPKEILDLYPDLSKRVS